jgi:hypothetical protein
VLATIAAVGALAVVGISFAVTALVRSEVSLEEEEKGSAANVRPYRELRTKWQQELTTKPTWASQAKGSVTLPIDRAMELTLHDIQKNPALATRLVAADAGAAPEAAPAPAEAAGDAGVEPAEGAAPAGAEPGTPAPAGGAPAGSKGPKENAPSDTQSGAPDRTPPSGAAPPSPAPKAPSTPSGAGPSGSPPSNAP